MENLSLDLKPGIPKYRQIVAAVEEAIVKGELKKGASLPSLNHIKNKYSLSRDTVLTAFNELKARGIIHSVVGKGYYVQSEDIAIEQKVFLLFDELNSFKEDLYNSFLDELGKNIQVDIYFHHFKLNVFNKLISDNVGGYNYYVIMPANLNGTENIISRLPHDKVYILDQIHPELLHYPSIHQNFKKDIYNGLQVVLNQIQRYKKAILLYNQDKEPKGILDGFNLFCEDRDIKHEVIIDLETKKISKGELYILLDDRSLIKMIKRIKEKRFLLAKDIGIISYNDTLLKEVVEGGITTISTNFKLMGQRLAEMILANEFVQVENPNSVAVRNSL